MASRCPCSSPTSHYSAVSDWINGHHLNGRIVYYRVPDQAAVRRIAAAGPRPDTLAAKLDVKDSRRSPRGWSASSRSRADVECVETMAEFRRDSRERSPRRARSRAAAAGTRRMTGSASTTAPGTCSAGPTSGRSTPCSSRATALAARIETARSRDRPDTSAEMTTAVTRGQVLASLEQTHEFAEIDYQTLVNRIADLRDEHQRLIAASDAARRPGRAAPRGQGSRSRRSNGDRRSSTASSAGVEQTISDAELMLGRDPRDPRGARLRAAPARTSPRSPPCWPRPGTSRRAPPPLATRRRRAPRREITTIADETQHEEEQPQQQDRLRDADLPSPVPGRDERARQRHRIGARLPGAAQAAHR